MKQRKLTAPQMEYRYRSWAKALSYRVTGTLYSFVVLYIITGKLVLSLSLSGIEIVSKIFIFYAHKRVWDKLKFGKIEHRPDYEI
jgi:uncharacterized membrane protein